jgi:hypothetical protein
MRKCHLNIRKTIFAYYVNIIFYLPMPQPQFVLPKPQFIVYIASIEYIFYIL